MKSHRGGYFLVCLVCALVLLTICFRAVIFGGQQFGYRDIAHFYYPLYQRVQQEWSAGRIPLWEPEENGGIPLMGNPTAAVLYPGKAIFGVLPYGWGMRVYVIGHLLLGFAGAVVLARSLGVGATGSLLAGLSYAFGAPVLFQYTNVIYLVGAAWLPLGFHAVDRLVRRHDRWAVPELSVVLALQMLGGDPQSAYLTLICGASYSLGLTWVDAYGAPKLRRLLALLFGAVLVWSIGVVLVASSARSLSAQLPALPAWFPSLSTVWAVVLACAGTLALIAGRSVPVVIRIRPLILGLGGACALSLALAAAHLIPTVEYSRQSFRALDRSPVEIYPFSVEPYRVLEFAWPGFYGAVCPENRYWLATIEPLTNHEFWSPSLYVGALTIVLALAAAGVRGGPPWRTWLTIVGIVGLIASLGRFGSPLWLARWIPALSAEIGAHDPAFVGPFRPDGRPMDGDGGLYWLMTAVLPGFGTFRFPAKLLTLTALSVSVLAGLGWDRLIAAGSKRVTILSTALCVAGLLALVGTLMGREAILAFWTRRVLAASSSLGPLVPTGALIELQRALIHGGIALAAAACLALTARRHRRLASVLAVASLGIDLAVANGRLVWSVPQAVFDRVPEAVRQIQLAEQRDPSPGPYRVHRMPHWLPYAWPKQGSAERLAEIVEWERDTVQPLYGLPEHTNYTMTKGALELYDYLWFFRPRMVRAEGPIADALGATSGQPILYYPRRGFDLWGTRYYLLPVRSDGWAEENRAYASFLNEIEIVYPKLDSFQGSASERKSQMDRWKDERDWQLFRSKTAYPRAWAVHEARFINPITGLDPADRERPMRLLLYQNDALWHEANLPVFDTRETALIETDEKQQLAPYLPGRSPADTDSVRVVEHTPQRVVIDATMARAGLVILADVFYPGWYLEIDGSPAPILRANRMMRGAAVRAGKHRLVYRYDPPSFRIGAIISVGALAVLGGTIFVASRGPKRQVDPGNDSR